MAILASNSVESPTYAQTFFTWEESVSQRPALPVAESCVIAEGKQDAPRSRRPASTVERRGRCEHVGGALATVLGNYGISIDALISEIERLKGAECHS